ncbi:DUF1016 N-terminal domain-containing protein [Chryseobacterium sp. MEBOG07]|uniref:DUF1016 N-terminal domain-containing protein n=1 Tax=Chryseobacterium sp. MEBOG07 TaxID=2879939 RepID=UPI001F22E729|nr:DUF1016 N-terminal domain-containing protein [Chryseobacterium sp. MEBOG07]UKB78849.1 DUF1016 N-terminal domain-containing protein [Chryseobacterium sp. MEBOG07]
MMEISEDSLFQSVKEIVRQSREKIFRIANSTLLLTYWQIGKLIVEDKQQGKESSEYGKGFDESSLRNMHSFYHAFPICDALRHESHRFLLLKIVKKQFICQQISAVHPQKIKIKTNY